MTYEVDSARGTCLYRGDDLELACDIYEHETDAHLQLLPDPRVPGDAGDAGDAGESRRSGVGWDRAPQSRSASS
jgi:hypothetical protein